MNHRGYAELIDAVEDFADEPTVMLVTGMPGIQENAAVKHGRCVVF